MRRSHLLLSLTLLGCTAAAHATTISAGTYTLYNASVAGYSVTGTVTVNSSGNATAANLTFNDAYFDNPGLPTFNQISSSNAFNGLSQNYLSSTSGSGQMGLYFNTTADYSGFFDLCLAGTQCGSASGTVDPSNIQIYGFYNSTTSTSNSGMAATNFSNGYLAPATAVAVTPEPASLIFVGSGVLGVIGLAGVPRSRLVEA